MIDKIVFLGCAIAFGVSLTFPAVPEIRYAVLVKEVRPLMQVLCTTGKDGRIEHERICRARKKSI